MIVTTPCISVLMPVYNAEKYLHQAVESILNQTFRDFECIVIDDGSTDGSKSILQKFQKQDQRIRLISRRNTGLTVALNEGLSYAKGPYIARMDADDVALPERFAKQLAFLEDNPNYVAVGTRVLLIDPEGWSIGPFSQQTTHEAIDAAHMAGRGGAICHPSVMIRHNALQSIGGYREEMEPCEDRDLFLRLAEIGKLANLKETLLQYRMHPKSVGHSRRVKQKLKGDLAVREAHHRRGLEPPLMLNPDNLHQQSITELHRKWAWWSLNAGNIATARKHALLALGKSPMAGQSWKVFACALRGR